MSGECPTGILKSEGTSVAYFNNFEKAPQVGGFEFEMGLREVFSMGFTQCVGAFEPTSSPTAAVEPR